MCGGGGSIYGCEVAVCAEVGGVEIGDWDEDVGPCGYDYCGAGLATGHVAQVKAVGYGAGVFGAVSPAGATPSRRALRGHAQGRKERRLLG